MHTHVYTGEAVLLNTGKHYAPTHIAYTCNQPTPTISP